MKMVIHRSSIISLFLSIVATMLTMLSPALAWPTQTIDIAAIYSLTGHAANANSSSVLGTRIAVDELNQNGGILGRKINLIVLDNMSTPIGSSMAANQAATAKVKAIIGAAWSSHSLIIAKIAQNNRIPMISNYSTNPKLTQIGEYIFRVCFTDKFQGKVMAEFARSTLKASTAHMFVDLTSEYSLELSKIFKQHFEKSGGIVLQEIEYKLKKQKIKKPVQAAKQESADVILLSGHDESGRIAKKLQDAGVEAVVLGGDGWADKSFFDFGGSELKLGYYCSHWSTLSETEISRAFVEKYQNRRSFGVGTALAYDAVKVLALAMETANSTEPERVRQALSELKSFQGVTGSITFDRFGDPVKSAVIMEIRNGQPRYLKTMKPN